MYFGGGLGSPSTIRLRSGIFSAPSARWSDSSNLLGPSVFAGKVPSCRSKSFHVSIRCVEPGRAAAAAGAGGSRIQ